MSSSDSRFQKRLHTLCRLHPQRIALPESEDVRVLAAACQMLREGTASDIVLFGEPDTLLQIAKQQGLPLLRFERHLIWAERDIPDLALATQLHIGRNLARRGKSLETGDLERLGRQALDQAAYLLAIDQVAAVVAGCTHTTAEVIRAALRGVGMAAGSQTISGSFAMIKESDAGHPFYYMYGDCGVVVDPNPEQLVDIAAATVQSYQALFPDLEPMVAFLSFSTKGSASHPMASKVVQAYELFQARYPNVAADGELQFDAAFDRIIGQRKAPGSAVAGRANCFIFPNLDAGNLAYKITQRLAGFEAYGPILQGTAKPYTDLSRGASVDDIITSSLIAMMRSYRKD